MFAGKGLFHGADTQEVLEKNQICDLSIIDSYIFCYSKEAKELLLKLLAVDPDKRPTALEALKEPWFDEEREALD